MPPLDIKVLHINFLGIQKRLRCASKPIETEDPYFISESHILAHLNILALYIKF
jgi:hypothetical protein